MFVILILAVAKVYFAFSEGFAGLQQAQDLCYICGVYPNQYYSIHSCDYRKPVYYHHCSNGGINLRIGCSFDYQCKTLYGEVAVCICGYCCTRPTPFFTTLTTPLDVNSYGYCYNGERSRMRCSSTSVCSSEQMCMNGLCCSITGNEWQNACAGLGALASCTNGSCGEFVCTTSNYCCECEFGRTSGLCSQGCSPGFRCSRNGYCCPSCPSGEVPYGSCYNGMCAAGHLCKAGNICCR